MTSILTNFSALQIIQNINATKDRLRVSQQRVATGLKVSAASDNAAFWSIAQGLSAKHKYWGSVEDGIKSATSAVHVAQKSAEMIAANFSEIRAAVVNYASTTSIELRDTLREGISKLITNNDNIIYSSSYNSANLLTKTTPTGLSIDSDLSGKVVVDYVFCLDISGSMGSILNATRSNVKAFADSRVTAGEDARFSFVTYSDVEVGNGSEPLGSSAFYRDANDFKSQLDGITLLGGGDTPESGLEALQLVRLQSFRPGATRKVIMITDATVHVSGDGSGSINSIDNTIANLVSDRIEVTIAGPIPQDSRLSAISAGTGGTYHDIADPAFFSKGFGIATPTVNNAPVFRVYRSPDGETIDIFHRSLLSDDLGLSRLIWNDSESLLNAVDFAINTATGYAAYLGASYNSLKSAADLADRMRDAYKSSISSILDADLDEESSRLSAARVQYEMSMQSLAIANAKPSILLSLFMSS